MKSDLQEIAYRYAKALMLLISDAKAEEQELSLLQEISDLLENSSEAKDLLRAPHITPAQKLDFLKHCFGEECSKQLYEFFFLLLLRRKFQYLPAIVREYRQQLAKKQGILEAELITALPMDFEAQNQFEKELGAKLNQKTRLYHSVNSQLISGGVLKIGNRMMDGSVHGKLRRLQSHLMRSVG